MKKILLLLGLTISIYSCTSSNSHSVRVSEPKVVVNPSSAAIGDNLDLQALGQLVQASTNAQEIEAKLNVEGSINNLDLNGDGSVDYIKVTEIGNGTDRGFSFTVDMPDGTSSEVATINIEQTNGMANMSVRGNEQYYGGNAYYHSSHELHDLMIMSYLFSVHRPYYSPYHYGYYPSTYRSYRSVPTTSYRTRTTTTRTVRSTPSRSTSTKVTSTRPTTKPVTQSTSRTSTLSKPTTSQKSFTTTTPQKARPTTTGFGNRRATTSSSSSSRPRTSGSSWGSSRSSSSSSRSFGSSSRSSSRSSSSRH